MSSASKTNFKLMEELLSTWRLVGEIEAEEGVDANMPGGADALLLLPPPPTIK